MPEISVLIPCYNAEAWVADSVGSIIDQTFKDIEILVYDDGSTDNTKKIVSNIAERDRRVTVHGGPNKGIVYALNSLLDVAKGKFIARMDADDLCHPDRLLRQRNFLLASGSDLCGSWCVEFGQGLSRVVRWPHGVESVHASLMFQNPICHPTLFGKREIFDAYRYRQDSVLAEDYDFFVRASQNFKLDNLNETLLHYRRHSAQATQEKREQMEQVTREIRRLALSQQGIYPSAEELRLHQMIRAWTSIKSAGDLLGIEQWLRKLMDQQHSLAAKRVVASQWLRACIRASPLGKEMLHILRQSALRDVADSKVNIDLRILAMLQLDYNSRSFQILRRFGLSA